MRLQRTHRRLSQETGDADQFGDGQQRGLRRSRAVGPQGRVLQPGPRRGEQPSGPEAAAGVQQRQVPAEAVDGGPLGRGKVQESRLRMRREFGQRNPRQSGLLVELAFEQSPGGLLGVLEHEKNEAVTLLDHVTCIFHSNSWLDKNSMTF